MSTEHPPSRRWTEACFSIDWSVLRQYGSDQQMGMGQRALLQRGQAWCCWGEQDKGLLECDSGTMSPMTPPTLVDAYTPHSMALADSHLSCILSLFASYTIDGSCWNWSTRTSDGHEPSPLSRLFWAQKEISFRPKISTYLLTLSGKKGIRKVGFYTIL